ncbi:permease [Gracilibacillus salitolerans]|uniref:Permease n=1 Tax=Gracilibacillus salitolerans TaxID=2663022 RepID=A0A5Q2TNH6_9BACI|nr:permease [Gracilibacillus salitolerans]QGH35563.1 permease [Gracilibacillus salitolerans]
MSSFISFIQQFLFLFLELTVLFIVISFMVSLIQQKVTEEQIKEILHRPNKWSGYLYGTGLGALTPFCSCSTIPILAGLLSSKAPFGPSMSFLVASPLLNPVIVILLWTFLGWEITVYYFVIVWIFAMVIGFVWEKFGFRTLVKDVRVRRKDSTKVESTVPKWKLALQDAWEFFIPVLPFLVLGVFIGAFIYNFVPESFIIQVAGSDKPWTIPIASIIGIPMYIRAEVMLPIGDALITKGMGIGAVIALLIGGAGASLPEVVLLSKLFKRKLVIAFVLSILFVAISTGFMIQLIL